MAGGSGDPRMAMTVPGVTALGAAIVRGLRHNRQIIPEQDRWRRSARGMRTRRRTGTRRCELPYASGQKPIQSTGCKVSAGLTTCFALVFVSSHHGDLAKRRKHYAGKEVSAIDAWAYASASTKVVIFLQRDRFFLPFRRYSTINAEEEVVIAISSGIPK
jgi:hypothetical protein